MAVKFIRSSDVIEKLRAFRTSLGYTSADFSIKGAGEFMKAQTANRFAQLAKDELYVMISNSSASNVSFAGSGVDTLTHNIDIAMFTRLDDIRGQGCDERAVFYKEFLVKALYGWLPDDLDGKPLQPAGDTFNNVQGSAVYSRVYQYQQTFDLDQSDIETGGQYEDLDDFTKLYTENNSETPDFGDIATTEIEQTIEQ